MKTIRPLIVINNEGKIFNMVEITLENGTVYTVEKDSIFDPTSKNYNAILDGNK